MLRILFEKTGDSVWISHLDLMRVFQRTFRRAGLLLKHSQGYNPRAIVSIALPLSVGVDSVCELLDFELEGETPSLENLGNLLNEKLPAGIRVREVYEAQRKIKELTHLRAELTMVYDQGIPVQAEEEIRTLLNNEHIVMEKRTKRGLSQVDLRPMLLDWTLSPLDDKTLRLDVVVCAQNPSLNPQLLVNAIETYRPQAAPNFSRCSRLEILDAAGAVFR